MQAFRLVRHISPSPTSSSSAPLVYLHSVHVNDDWNGLKFVKNADNTVNVAGVVMKFDGEGVDNKRKGLTGLTFYVYVQDSYSLPSPSIITEDLCGIDVTIIKSALPFTTTTSPSPHGNHIDGIDHIVINTDDHLEFEHRIKEILNLSKKRERCIGKLSQCFYTTKNVVLEVIGPASSSSPAPSPSIDHKCSRSEAFVWGIAFTSSNIHAGKNVMGDMMTNVKNAVQTGRQIATLKGGQAANLAVLTHRLPLPLPSSLL